MRSETRDRIALSSPALFAAASLAFGTTGPFSVAAPAPKEGCSAGSLNEKVTPNAPRVPTEAEAARLVSESFGRGNAAVLVVSSLDPDSVQLAAMLGHLRERYRLRGFEVLAPAVRPAGMEGVPWRIAKLPDLGGARLFFREGGHLRWVSESFRIPGRYYEIGRP